jgi:hypothetical protein
LIGAVIGFFAIVGSLLPRSYSFTSEIEINADQTEIFSQINTLPNWRNWSRQWNPTEIENLEIQYNGQPTGVGAAQSWTDVRGTGKLWITESSPNHSIEYEMTFENRPTMFSKIELVPGDSTTNVRWSSEGKLPGGPFYGYFGSFFSTHMKEEYDKSLEKLKKYVEDHLDPPPVEEPE